MKLFSFLADEKAIADQAIEAAVLRSDRFRQEREADWKRLEAIVGQMEKGRIRRISDADMLDLVPLYRTAVSSLSIARETSLDAAALGYLESLVQRAWFQVYGPQTSLWAWLGRFLGGEWGRAVRAIWTEILVALALMMLGTWIGWSLCQADPDWFYSFFPVGPGETRVSGASGAVLKDSLFGNQAQGFLGAFSASLFSHNAGIAILCFALGFAFGIPPLMLLIQNTTMLGAMLWLFHSQGLTIDVIGWLSIHGTTELLAILLSGAAGLHIGRSMAFPGERSLLDAAAAAGQRSAVVMAGVALMLVCAGLLEGIGRQLIDSTAQRLIVGYGMLAFWLAYFFLFRRAGAERAMP